MCLAACFCIIRQVSPSFILRDDVNTFFVFEEINDSKYVLAFLTATLRVCLWDREACCFAVICIGGNSLNYDLRPEWFKNGPHNFTICTYMNLSFDCVRFKLRSIALCLYDSICERYPFLLGPQEELSDLFTVFDKFESNLKQFLLVYPLYDCLFVLFLRHQIDLFFCYCTGWINGNCFVTAWKGEYSIHMELQFDFAPQPSYRIANLFCPSSFWLQVCLAKSQLCTLKSYPSHFQDNLWRQADDVLVTDFKRQINS